MEREGNTLSYSQFRLYEDYVYSLKWPWAILEPGEHSYEEHSTTHIHIITLFPSPEAKVPWPCCLVGTTAGLCYHSVHA